MGIGEHIAAGFPPVGRQPGLNGRHPAADPVDRADQGFAVLGAEGGASCSITAGFGSQLDECFDADFAAETTNMTKAQILRQAATSMLAQANVSKKDLLTLLQM